jgi:hypothetical protein
MSRYAVSGDMSETSAEERYSGVIPFKVRDSLYYLAGIYGGGIYKRLSNGDLRYEGERPGPGWHGHGYFAKRLEMLDGGKPRTHRVWKHRWRLSGTNRTCHSRPPEDLVMVGFCTLIVFLRIYACLSSPRGFHNRGEVFEDLSGCGTDRTVQRWLARAMRNAVEIQQAIGAAAREIREPRPGEDLFEGGLSPPDYFYCRQWQNPLAVEALLRAVVMLLVATKELDTNASLLLAEARRRCQKPEKPFPI